jgi:DNA-binding transcriptional MerR regulator
MARPKVSSEMTTTIVSKNLGISTGQLIRWVEHGALPPPSRYDRNGVRYFNQDWLAKAKEIVKQMKGIA